MIAGKIWGTTEVLLKNEVLEIHRINTKTGGYCSKHHHEHKYNLFYVISGVMEISVWKKDYDLIDVTILDEGDSMIVKPGEQHRFYARVGGEAMEVYWNKTVDSNDIVRESHGGFKPPKT